MKKQKLQSLVFLMLLFIALPAYAAGPVILIYEACHAGSFVPLLKPAAAVAGKTRIVLASAGANEKAWFDVNGMMSFSRYFWMGVADGNNVAICYSFARQCMQKPKCQTAQLDADGDGVPDELVDDLIKAVDYKIGRGLVNADVYPVVGEIMPETWLYSSSQSTSEIWAGSITPSSSIQLVWAIINRPDSSGQIDDRAIVNPPYVTLLLDSSDGRCKGEYDNFTASGVDTIAVYALDKLNNVSQPKATKEIDDYEEDDTAAQAKPIVVNSDVSQFHNFWDTNDVDWVQFYGMEGYIYAITVTGQGPRCAAVIELYESDNATLIDRQVSGLVSWDCPADGLYFVKIYSGNGLYGLETNYELKVYNPAAPVLGMIKGTVTNGSSPILNARIWTTGGYSAVSGSSGYEMPHEGGGPYTLTADAAGYQTYTQAGINLGAREVRQIDIVMTPVGGTTTTTTSVVTTTTSVSTTTTSSIPTTTSSVSTTTTSSIPTTTTSVSTTTTSSIPTTTSSVSTTTTSSIPTTTSSVSTTTTLSTTTTIVLSSCIDNDGDGYGLNCAKGTDCNDHDLAINPGVDEICGDGIDNNCNGLTDEGCKKCSLIKLLGDGDPKLANFRSFRDKTFAKSVIGRKIIQIYYTNTDSINAALDSSPALQAAARRVLEAVAPMLVRKEE